MFGTHFFKFGASKKNNSNNKDGIYESSIIDSPDNKRRKNNLKSSNMNDDIEEVDEGHENSNKSQDYSPSYTRIKQYFLNNEIEELFNTNIKAGDYKTQKNNNILKKEKKNSSKELISEDNSLYDKSDYEKTLRLGTIMESDSFLETTNDNTNNNKNKNNNNNNNNKIKIKISHKKIKDYKSKSLKKILNLKKAEAEKKNYTSVKKINQKKQYDINNINNPNYIPKNKIKKYIFKINNLEKKSNSLNQLLFCARVAIENALDVCQTISSCYKWVGENYLESQIKKVIKKQN